MLAIIRCIQTSVCASARLTNTLQKARAAAYTLTMKAVIELTDYYIIQRWKESFLALNKARLEIAQQVMSSRQYRVLSVLPILLHINHSRLPGFVSKQVPSGIVGYTPTSEHKRALQDIARGLRLPDHDISRSFAGVYLMGSVGSIAQSEDSDLDVWLCYEQPIAAAELELLQQKCRRIEQWAAQLGTEVHIFPMNLLHLRQGQHSSLEGDDCGSSQHMLLLDEFYRSAVYLAGAMPRWWVIPRQYEAQAEDYWQALLDANRVQPKHWLNMGEIATIPADEFIGAGLWQLHKGLSKPYKSLLKLALTHHYAQQYPAIQPLCWDLKQRLHQGDHEPVSCDAYLLLLDRLEQIDDACLPLVRRSFYFKLGVAISRQHSVHDCQWRSRSLRQRLKHWQWNMKHIRHLDQRQQWTPYQVMEERQQVVGTMLSWYRDLYRFSRQHNQGLHIDPADLRQLGNRLAAAFESRSGKINRINPNIRSPFRLQQITVRQQASAQSQWQLYLIAPYQLQQQLDSASVINDSDAKNQTVRPLITSHSLIEVLAFAFCNQLLDNDTRVALQAGRDSVGQYEIRELARVLLNIPTLDGHGQDFSQPAIPRQVYLFLNIGRDAQAESHGHGLHTFSKKDDAFNYSEHRQNLLRTIDMLTINSWGEWQVTRLAEGDIILQALQQLLTTPGLLSAEHHVVCASRGQAAAIRERFQSMLQDIVNYFSHPKAPRYLLQTAHSFYLIENPQALISVFSDQTDLAQVPQASSHQLAGGHDLRAPDASITAIADMPRLLAYLARRREDQYGWQLDRYALRNTPLRCVLDHHKARHWQVFYWYRQQKLWLFIRDEGGSLLQYQQPLNNKTPQQTVSDPQQLVYLALKPLLQFLQGLLTQQQKCQQRQDAVRGLLLFRLQQDAQQRQFVCLPQRLPELKAELDEVDLWGRIEELQQGPRLTLGIGRTEFADNGYQDVYTQLVDYWLENCLSGDRLHIKRLSLGNEAHVLTQLKYWQQIEQRLRSSCQQARLKLPSR